MIYIFDIDGTLADCSHRLHFIQQKPADWSAFFAACSEDDPILDVLAVASSLYDESHGIVLISGRSDECRDKTESWLRRRIPYTNLYMRRAGDHRPDNIVKSELLDKFIQEYPGISIGGVFEDRQQVVDMYRARGLRVFQVAEGKF